MEKSIKEIYKIKSEYLLTDHYRRRVYSEPVPRLWSMFSLIPSHSKSTSFKELKRNKKYYNLYNLDTFFSKDEAYRYSDSFSRLPMFSVDKSDDVAKKWYIVCGYEDWWKFYSNTDRKYRYAYEVVLPEMECHLYVDAEASLKTNDNSVEYYNELFQDLLVELRYFMRKWFIAPSKNLNNTKIVVLDSSKPTKFSKHCIIKIPEAKFKNNYYCGAFVRQFHLYILEKYGNGETNKFYVNCDKKDDESGEFKQFIIDLGVYTKGRDFRLLGSRKRVSTEKRWLWIEGKDEILTKEDFFDSLIQYQPHDQKIKYLISNVPDTLNNGVPLSSSLRTVSPKGTTPGQTIRANINSEGFVTSYGYDLATPYKKQKTVQPSEELIQRLVQYIYDKFKIKATKVSVQNGTIIFNTMCRSCLIKRYITKNKKAEHSKNMIFFIINPRDGSIYQSCFNNTYCVEPETQTHRRFKLGYIQDMTILNLFSELCKENNWVFRFQYQEIDECLIESDSE